MDKIDLDLTDIKTLTDLFAAAVKDKLADNGTNASGNLSKSIKGKVKFDGKWLEIELSLLDYWRYVENGRKKGKRPPLEAIREWIITKPIIPYTKGKKVPTEQDLAVCIARKIGRYGTKPQPFVAPTVTDFKLVDKVESILYSEFDRIFREEIDIVNNLKIE